MNIFTQYEMKVVFPRLTFCMGCTSNILHVPFHWQRNFTQSSKMSLGGFEKHKISCFVFTVSFLKSSYRYSQTPNFLLESWPCHTKFTCINIRAFQKYHKYHVSGSRTRNKKEKRGTRKGAESAGYLVCRFFLQHLHMALYAGEVFFKVNRIQANKI